MPRPRKTHSEKLEALQLKKSQIDARIQKAEARSRLDSRKRDTRRKIVAGAIVLEHAEKDSTFAQQLHALLAKFVTRPQDKALFDLSKK